MVAIEEVVDDDTTTNNNNSGPTPSEIRLLDADEIEKIVSQLTRPTAKMHIESLVKKIRKEASQLKALEATSLDASVLASANAVLAAAPVEPPKPVAMSTGAVVVPSVTYTTIDRFAFDAGTSQDKFVTLYVPIPEVGSIENKAEQIKCDFGTDSFDVTVMDLKGKNYRLKRDRLEHDIVPEKSKHIVKKDKIVVKLHKKSGGLESGGLGGGFDMWTKLTDPKWKDKKKKSTDPTAGLMDMMKDMYDTGDENMKKVIGEAMLKNRNGMGQDPSEIGSKGAFGLDS